MKQVIDKLKCCGCNACGSVCPKQAISLQLDEYGFIFPVIDESKCIDCGLCLRTCPMINDMKLIDSQIAYAATNKDNESIKNCASGGIFYTLAKKVVDNGAYVFGTYLDEKFDAKVIGVNSSEELQLLVGSKYVQSSIGSALKEIKNLIKTGKKVMFCGTPCQVAAVKSLVNGNDANLLLVDIVCHGTPNNQFFKDYIKTEEKKQKAKIAGFVFRDKNYGQDTKVSITYDNGGNVIRKCLYPFESSYYSLFLKGITFRNSCYQCPYAEKKRAGDITICDFWGIDEECPEVAIKLRNSGAKTISGVVINSEKGRVYFDEVKSELLYEPVDYISLQKQNPQLTHPYKNDEVDFRRELFNAYKNIGYDSVDKLYYQHYKKYVILRKFSKHFPMKIKKILVSIRDYKK